MKTKMRIKVPKATSKIAFWFTNITILSLKFGSEVILTMGNSTDTHVISQCLSLGADTVQFIFVEISESLELVCDT